MKFNEPAPENPIDRERIIGKPIDRVEGPLKVSGRAPYAYERHDVAPDAAYGWVVGAGIAKGRIARLDTQDAEAAPGVLAVISYKNAGPLGKGRNNVANLLAAPEIEHFDQAIAVVVAETLEQARDAAKRVHIDYENAPGRFDLAADKDRGITPPPFFGMPADTAVGDFDSAFAKAAITIDQSYTTPGHSHAMIEPHATTAAWSEGKLTLWTATQMVAGVRKDAALTLRMKPEDIRIVSPYTGGGFGAKLFLRADALLAAIGARAIGRPVKVALTRPQIANNTTHRPATIQRIRLGANKDGVIDAIAHESWSSDLPGGKGEFAAVQTRSLYRGAHRLTRHRHVELDLPEGNAMRAPGEAAGMLALEVAMDELAEACGVDPVELRIRNDVQYDPEAGPDHPYSSRPFIACLREGAERFGWARRNPQPGQMHEGRWLIGMGMAAAFRKNVATTSGARIGVDNKGRVIVETDMTDIGTGSYTILAQTAAEMLGVEIEAVEVRLGDSRFPVSSGSGGQWGANSASSGVYAACVLLRDRLAQKTGLNSRDALFEDGHIKAGGRSIPLGEAAGADGVWAEDNIEFGNAIQRSIQGTFGAHFCEVGVDIDSCEVRVRRLDGVFAAGRILNPKSARSQVIGSMVMGVGAALMEELVVDTRFGNFVTRDLAEYHVPVHADIPHQNVFFLEERDAMSSPMKAKGVGELGICGVGAAVANAVYNATGVRVRNYPITLDKLLAKMAKV